MESSEDFDRLEAVSPNTLSKGGKATAVTIPYKIARKEKEVKEQALSNLAKLAISAGFNTTVDWSVVVIEKSGKVSRLSPITGLHDFKEFYISSDTAFSYINFNSSIENIKKAFDSLDWLSS